MIGGYVPFVGIAGLSDGIPSRGDFTIAQAISPAISGLIGRFVTVILPSSNAIGRPIRGVGGPILGFLGRLALSLPGGETESEAHVLYFRAGNCLPDPPLRRRRGLTIQRTALTDSTLISQHAPRSLERMRPAPRDLRIMLRSAEQQQ